MKLVFRKNAQEEITVLQSYDGDERDFIYVDMIKALLKDGQLEVPTIEGAFTEEEQRSINNMVSEINRETKEAMKACGGTEEPNDNPPFKQESRLSV
jgi:ABC-type uncharacterized transport system substrate-binding protein